MRDEKKIIRIIPAFLTISVLISIMAGMSLAAEQPAALPKQPMVITGESSVTINPAAPTVLAAQGLSAVDQTQLEQQNRFVFKGKQALLSPYMGGVGESAPGEAEIKARSEQEKLYRYFDAAMKMYKEGRTDEAIEILQYINGKKPDDKYVKSCLDKIMNEKALGQKHWTAVSESNAGMLKEKKIKELINEGIGYYKQKDFDTTLLKFADVLALDPNNAEAKKYFDKLKQHYLKEVHIESLVENFENPQAAKSHSENNADIKNSADAILANRERDIDDKVEKMLAAKEEGVFLTADKMLVKKESEVMSAADSILEDEEMKAIVAEKRIKSALDQAELGLTIDEIVTKKKEEERKAALYTLGPGDIILISVRDHPELSGKATVGLGGTVILPLVNDVVNLKGATLPEATEIIKKAMERYVKDPYITLLIDDYRSKTFYIIDEVGCTPYPITRANLTLRDALFIADWGDDRALGRVIVIKSNNLHPIIRKVDAFNIIYRGNTADNIKIEDGDVIYIPLTVSAKITKVIADTIQPFAAVRSARDEWLNLKGDIKSWKELPKIRQDISDGYDSLWGIGNEGSSGSTI
ncbi:MAG: polysaccharide biosynthesis/export family protein [Candidatus Omnitrophica bacterium]|nr:polysaccharide biosynthesis/export family protein [Candidatus Omnitrophota bacterium]